MATPRLLADENVPGPSIRLLRDEGLDVAAIAERSPGMTDRAVLELARNEQRWLLTCDRDFGELVFAANLPPPDAIVLLRDQTHSAMDPGRSVLALLENPMVSRAGFFVVDIRGVRWRPFHGADRSAHERSDDDRDAPVGTG